MLIFGDSTAERELLMQRPTDRKTPLKLVRLAGHLMRDGHLEQPSRSRGDTHWMMTIPSKNQRS
ncbi:hypothetical protein, partial [Xanthomonas populi]|uniref:hypothetical protein n=1 Tax=Xanthomonas populi TaxID=53414 RepID=UPI001ABEEBB1